MAKKPIATSDDHVLDALRYVIEMGLMEQDKPKCRTTWWRRLKLWITNPVCRHCKNFWKEK